MLKGVQCVEYVCEGKYKSDSLRLRHSTDKEPLFIVHKKVYVG